MPRSEREETSRALVLPHKNKKGTLDKILRQVRHELQFKSAVVIQICLKM